MVLARSVGCKAILVRTGLGEGSLEEYRHLWADIEPDFVAENILGAAKWIVESEKSMTELVSARDFPNLFGDTIWGALKCRFELRDSPPPANLIGSVNIVPFVGDQGLMIRLQNGEWEIPGGTLEPGESYLYGIRRELLEEAGARLVTFEPLGAWCGHSSASKPYRPHLPHPELYRFVGYGAVEIITEPQCPAGGERVEGVECVSVEEASQRFLAIGRAELAELYRLAAAVGDARASGRKPSTTSK